MRIVTKRLALVNRKRPWFVRSRSSDLQGGLGLGFGPSLGNTSNQLGCRARAWQSGPDTSLRANGGDAGPGWLRDDDLHA